jgi:two-component system phosphate regulon sensor histidine kinase PhoR
LLDETIADLRPLLESRQQRCLQTEHDRTDIVGDSRRLRQVITNLVSNAIKFTGERGTITTAVQTREDHVELSIRDTGRGIAPEDIGKIFDRYTRVTQHGDEVPGTGLGLMIVREIIEAHGGSVGVESSVGSGSRFWFRLPRSVSPGAGGAANSQPKSPPARARTAD